MKEFGDGPLRECKYPADDARYLCDCQQCARRAGTVDIKMDETAFYEGAKYCYKKKSPYGKQERYSGVPVRQNFGYDWPYAMRRAASCPIIIKRASCCIFWHCHKQDAIGVACHINE